MRPIPRDLEGKRSLWRTSVGLLWRARRLRVKPDTVTYNAIIGAVSGSNHHQSVGQVLARMRSHVVLPNVVTYNAMLKAFDQGGGWEEAVSVLARIHANRLTPDIITFNGVISSCAWHGHWARALSLASQALKAHLTLDSISYNTIIHACAKGNRWEWSIHLFEQLRKPDIITFGSVIIACERGSQWQIAASMLNIAGQHGILPDTICLNAALSAYEKGEQWKRAIDTLRNMQVRGPPPSPTSYSVIMLACFRGEQWALAFNIWQEMRSIRVKPEMHSLSRLLTECELRGLHDLDKEIHNDMARSSNIPSVVAAISNSLALRIMMRNQWMQAADVLQRAAHHGDSNNLSKFLLGCLDSRGFDKISRSAASQWLLDVPRLTAYSKELNLLQHVLTTAIYGNPSSICAAMEQFAKDELFGRSWLKIAGGPKSAVLLASLQGVADGGSVLEIGTYCGYSSVLMASAIPGLKVETLECDAMQAVIARNIIAFAGLSSSVRVWTGHSKDLIPRISTALNSPAFRGVFMDQRGSRYHQDLNALVEHGLLMPGAVIVADNVLKPGAPLFLWFVTTNPGFATKLVNVPEFAMPVQDWMSISIYKGMQELSMRSAPEPLDLLLMHSECDQMRKKALNPRRGVSFADWDVFAEDMRRRLQLLGIIPCSAYTC